MLRTPLHEWHLAHGGRMVEFAGWSMPVQYTTIADEHHAVRNAAGLFDISHMGVLTVRGTDAAPLLDRLVTCRVASSDTGRIRYGLVTNESGGVLDDVLVYRRADDDFFVVVNASNRGKIAAWVASHASGLDARLTPPDASTGMIALQGPDALRSLAPHVDQDIASLKYYRFADATAFGVPVVVSRTGYTGEIGFELIVPAGRVAGIWSSLLAANAGLVPCGLGCRDTLRLEAAMPLYGHELSEAIDPLSARLDFAVDLGKEFVGVESLRAIAADGLKRVRVGLRLAGKRIAREGTRLLVGEAVVGEITSGTFSPTLQASIAMGYLPSEFATEGTPIGVDLRGKREAATVVSLPFYRRPPRR